MIEDTFDSLKKERDELKNFVEMKRKEEKRQQIIGDSFIVIVFGIIFWSAVDYISHMATTGLRYSIITGGVDQPTGSIYMGMVVLSKVFLFAFGMVWFVGRINNIYGEYYPEICYRLVEAIKTLLKTTKNKKDL